MPAFGSAATSPSSAIATRVKDTQLSYAGLRDPGSVTHVYSGNIWGGVISTTGGARIDVGGEKSGLYISADGGTLTGYHVLDNKKYEGLMGAYFRVPAGPAMAPSTSAAISSPCTTTTTSAA